jgi:hypothetical protein
MRVTAVVAALMALFLSTSVAAQIVERPKYQAVSVSRAPVVDGDLSDEAWKGAPEITDFTQHNPDDGKPATRKTVVRIVYTDEAIYFGAMMYDSTPVATLLARRDSYDLQSDWFRVNISPQHDGLSGAEFWVTPTNVQVDGILYNDIDDDFTWDAVWSSATRIIPGVGWAAEFRIPYSQLRFQRAEEQTWGLNFTREILSSHETDRLVNIPKGQTGWVSKMAELTGIRGISPKRTFELVPYGVVRNDLANHIAPGDPFTRSYETSVDGGLDVKYGLSSNLTLTGTINPDFGQVEVDPAVVNLSQFETFFPEKRPFFTEGAQIFRFGTGPANNRFNFNMYPPQFFYSRRIGRPPQGTSSLSGDYVSFPTETTILGAAKVTGKFGKGWSVGVLDAVTARENAWSSLDGVSSRVPVEPATNYFVARTTKEYGGGNSRIGFMAEQVHRSLPENLSFLRRDATIAGIDGYTRFHRGDWLFEWQTGATSLSGRAEAIAALQIAPAHNYARPDATYLHYDPTRTSLDGYGGRVMFTKLTGHWMPNIQIQSYSPGFDVNDIGYEQRVDVINAHMALIYDNQELKKYGRSINAWAGKYDNWNYGGDHFSNGIYGNFNLTWQNYWYTFGSGGKEWPTLDDRKTRGGPMVRNPGNSDIALGVGTDSRRKFYAEVSSERFVLDDGGKFQSYNTTLTWRPTSSIRLSISPSYNSEHDASQFVTNTEGDERIFSQLEQHNFQMGTRVEWTLSSRVSFQLYTQPLVAAGDYHDFSRLARPQSGEYTPVSYDGNPDFNFRSARSSAVARWEFRPGSSLYVVWSENRADVEPFGDFHFRRDVSAIPSAASQDVFLIKVSYWLPM